MSSQDRPLVFVTGATGFLGRHLVKDLCDQGYLVRALVRDPQSPASLSLDPRAEKQVGDISDPETLKGMMAGCRGLFHCAGKVSRNPDDALLMHEVNVQGTQNCLQAAKAAGVSRCVLASTSGVVAISDDPNKVSNENDSTPLELLNRFPYYRSKYYAEQGALAMNDEQMQVICVNPSLLLGPGDLHGSSTEDVQRFLEFSSPYNPQGGLAFVDARDAASAMRLAFERGVAGDRYLLASCNCTFRTFLGRLARIAGTAAPTWTPPSAPIARDTAMWLSEKLRTVLGDEERIPQAPSVEMSYYYWYVDASKAEAVLGWKARDPMLTLSDTISDLRERGKIPLSYE